MLDACRDVLYTSKSSSRNSIRTKRYDEAEVSAIFYSTKAGFFSYEDDESDYGVFTKYLIYGMEGKADENKDGVVSFYELEQYVQAGVKDWSLKKNKQQKPFTRLNSERTGDLAITIANNPDVSLVDKPVPKPSRSPYVLRSLILPGWGQFYEEKRKRGYAFSILSGLLFLNWYFKDKDHKTTQSEFDNLPIIPAVNGEGNVFAQNYLFSYSKREELNNSTIAVNQAFTILALVWFYNVFDAYYFKKEQNFFNLQFSMYKVNFPSENIPLNSKVETIYDLGLEWRF
ncbi:MAG: hypothetical protein KDK36_10765 [Leptospiraceae bacterium]|nr:hypothetical protein [Leptospiraceae bacterium]